MKLSVEGEEEEEEEKEAEGGVWWGNPVCCSLWDFSLLSLVPVFKMLHTLVKTHTVPPSHCRGNLLWGRDDKQLVWRAWSHAAALENLFILKNNNLFFLIKRNTDTQNAAMWSGFNKKNRFPCGITMKNYLFIYLCQLLGFVVKWIHDFAHVLNCFQGCFVCFVHRGLFKYDQDAFTLVKDSCGRVIKTDYSTLKDSDCEEWMFFFTGTGKSDYRETFCPESSVIISSRRLPAEDKRVNNSSTFWVIAEENGDLQRRLPLTVW